MKPRAEKNELALRDLAECGAYIGRASLQAELGFYDAAEAAFAQLCQMPHLGRAFESRNDRLVGLRCHPIRGFDHYMIFYRPTACGIEVVRVIHGARNLDRVLDLPDSGE